MVVNDDSRTLRRFKFGDELLGEMTVFFQGLVDQHMRINGTPFTARTLVGKGRLDWRETPLQKLWEYYEALDEDEMSVRNHVNITIGWLLKLVLVDDQQTYRSCLVNGGRNRIREYSLI